MATALPEYVVRRIRRTPPDGCSVLDNCTPVLSFGDPQKAQLATVGLNPSIAEFLDSDGNELHGSKRRFETLRSLGLESLERAPTAAIHAVVDACNCYFSRNPYWRWFGKFRAILDACRVSYQDGTACHLDLVQWATNPKWRDLWDGVRSILLRDDVPFFREQLQNSGIRTILLNGRSVVTEFMEHTGIQLLLRPTGVSCGNQKVSLFHGKGPNHLLILGWSVNIQSSHGVGSDTCRRLAIEVQQLYRDLILG